MPEYDVAYALTRSEKDEHDIEHHSLYVKTLKRPTRLVPFHGTGIVRVPDGATYRVRDGVFHSDAHPAFEFTSKLVQKRIWYHDGVMHRDGDEPAWQEQMIREDGSLATSIKVRYRRGVQHHEHLPAYSCREWNRQGLLYYQRYTWCRNGEPHREGDQPADVKIQTFRDGACQVSETWYKYGVKHGENTSRPAHYEFTCGSDDDSDDIVCTTRFEFIRYGKTIEVVQYDV